MSTKIQHIGSNKSSTTRNGGPGKPKELPQYIPVPKTLMTDKKMPLGAKLLWGVIQQGLMPDWRCYMSDEALGQALAVSDRQLRRYLKALESANLLRTTQRPGKTPFRELLWHSRFEEKFGPGGDTSVRGGGQICPGGRTEMSALYKELKLVPKTTTQEGGAILKVPAPKTDDALTRKPVRVVTEEEYRARGRAQGWPEHVIERDLERFREQRRNAQAERMVTASELKAELEESIRR